MDKSDLTAVLLTVKLALITTVILLVIGIPIAWWLKNSSSKPVKVVRALVSLPLVLPPTVLGFYLLILMGPHGPIGKLMLKAGLPLWPFTFKGLVFASVIYSFPFVVQPLHNAFEALGKRSVEAAYTLGASPLDAFFTVILPQVKKALLTAAILGFSHTLGEFGVILMIGGNIPGVTQVISMQIYGYVEAMEYGKAHMLAGGMLIFSFIVLLSLQLLNSKDKKI